MVFEKLFKKIEKGKRKVEAVRGKVEAFQLRRLKEERERKEARVVRAKLLIKEHKRIKAANKIIGQSRGTRFGGNFGASLGSISTAFSGQQQPKPVKRIVRRPKKVRGTVIQVNGQTITIAGKKKKRKRAMQARPQRIRGIGDFL